MSRTLFFIPARGGSKGIPGKNIKEFAGKPLILHSIDQARAFAEDSDICLSTDSEKIAAVARQYGLPVPFLRPAELASDTASTQDAIIHALDFYREKGIDYDTVVLLQPTSPLRTLDNIKEALELYDNEVDMVVSVCEAATNPYYNAFEIDENGFLHISKGDGLYTRRQDAPKVWEYNGAIYVINVNSLRKTAMGSFQKRRMYEMSRENSVDLDSPLDWITAETILKSRSDK